jgi:hypothetical protein
MVIKRRERRVEGDVPLSIVFGVIALRNNVREELVLHATDRVPTCDKLDHLRWREALARKRLHVRLEI